MTLHDTCRWRLFQGFDGPYLERLRTRDPETERHFITYFSELILIKLRGRIFSRQLIDDVRQETFLRMLRILRSADGIREPERLGPFVNSVCNNVLREQLRSERRHAIPSGEPPDAPDTVGPDPESRLISKERKRVVRLVIEELPERDREVLRALFVEQRSRDEVCARLGVDRSYLRVLLHRAKESFLARLAQRPPLSGPNGSSVPGGRPRCFEGWTPPANEPPRAGVGREG
jgi:RNA polymerase sigma-70 factor, ECF subfamily